MTDERVQAYRHFIETITLESIDRLDELAAPDMRFRDPFVDVRGIDQVKKGFRDLFKDIEDPRFTITHCACQDDVCFLRWNFTCRPIHISKGRPWVIDGVTEVHFDARGRVIDHIDHWDAGRYVYERLPWLRELLKIVKRRLLA